MSNLAAIAMIVWFISFVLAAALGADKGHFKLGVLLGFLLGILGLAVIWVLPGTPRPLWGQDA